MAHDLTIRANGKAEMAFVGETPWHGLGQPVTQGASIGVWQKEAGMDWDAIETPVEGWSQPEGPHTVSFPDYKGIYRSDDYSPLAIVGTNYKLVQPKEVLEFFRDMTEEGGWHIHTAGTLRGGRKLWAMASNGGAGNVSNRRSKGQTDEVRHNLLLATSLDGSMKTTVVDTAVRVVCANTLALALRDNQRVIQISHRSIFDAAAVKRALGVANESFEAFMQTARDLADRPVDLEEARNLLNQIFQPNASIKPSNAWLGSLKEMEDAPLQEERRIISTTLDLFQGAGLGSTLKSAAGTRWGLLNAVTQQVDWAMGRSDDTRLDSAWFGRGNEFKKSAFEILSA